MKRKVLVTGGMGYIGSHTVVELQNSGYNVVIVDNLSNSRKFILDRMERVSGIRPVFYEADLCNHQQLSQVPNSPNEPVFLQQFWSRVFFLKVKLFMNSP